MLFVSHATADDALVNKFVSDLRAAGLTDDLWVDHIDGIGMGDEWQRSIHAALNNCDAGIFILTLASAESRECEAEWRRILALKKRLYIALLKPVALEAFPFRLAIIQYADLTKDPASAVRALVKAITGKVALSPADPGVATMKRITGEGDIDSSLSMQMYGRDADLDEALRKLRLDPLFIVGIGGLGKSRLAYALVEQDEWSGAIWHRANELTTAEDVLLLLRQHYALELKTDENAILDQVRTDGHLLVVIDNAELVNETARSAYIRLVGLLDRAGASVCITSREVWRDAKAKQTHEPSKLSLEAAAHVVSIFAGLLGVIANVAPHAENIASAARFHPRLIELAVGKLDYMPASDVISELLALQSEDTQEALKEMIGITVSQMTAKHRDLPLKTLRRLAVCRGGFTAEAGQDISKRQPAAFFSHMRILTDYRFVRFNNERYSIEDLVREAVHEDKSARRAHYDCYRAFAEKLDSSPDHLKYVKMDAERDNLDAAFEWSIAADPEVAYWLANECVSFLSNRGRWTQRLDWFIRLEVALAAHNDIELRANVQNSLGNVLSDHPFGDSRDNHRRAIAIYEAVLLYWTPDVSPPNYAMAQNNLGAAYWSLASVEDRESNLRRAVAAYQTALVYRTPESAPLDYATTQNNLGAAYMTLSTVEDREANLKRAVIAYQAALVYWTVDAAPLEHAMTQYNLAVAYMNLAKVENRASNLRRALIAYEAALIYWTPDAAPLNYAQTQYSLGVTYVDLAEVEDRIDNLQRALAAYKEALIYWTSDAVPLSYAQTQNSLGSAYADLAELEDCKDNLQRAVAACEAALIYRTPDIVPIQYAATQNTLGIVYWKLADVDDRLGNLHRSIEKFKLTLAYYTVEDTPLEYANTHNNIGKALRSLATVEDKSDNLRRAIAEFEEALSYVTPENEPLQYSRIQNNLGEVYTDLVSVEDKTGNLQRAIAAFKSALINRTPDNAPLGYAETQFNLGVALEASGDLPAAIICWYEAESYYRQMDAIEAAERIRERIVDAEAQLNAPPDNP